MSQWSIHRAISATITIWKYKSLKENKVYYVVQNSKYNNAPDKKQLSAKQSCRTPESAYKFSSLEAAEYYITLTTDFTDAFTVEEE